MFSDYPLAIPPALLKRPLLLFKMHYLSLPEDVRQVSCPG